MISPVTAIREVVLRQPAEKPILTHIHGVPVAERVAIVYVKRDYSQSETGNGIPMDNPDLLEVTGSYGKFNKAGPLKIVREEDSGGAQVQVDVLTGRDPAATMKKSVAQLDPDVESRPLLRSSFLVGLEALHPNDVAFGVRLIMDALGAKEGRKILAKGFQAQNNPQAQDVLRQAVAAYSDQVAAERGAAKNIHYETAFCYTADPVYDGAYYAAKTRALLAPGDAKVISIKDMGGQLNGDEGSVSDGNCAALVRAILPEIIAYMEQHPDAEPLTLSIHSHDTGHAAAANAAGIAALLDEQRKQGPDSTVAKIKITVDLMPGLKPGVSFANLRATDAELKKRGYDLGVTDQQWEIHDEQGRHIENLRNEYREHLIDTSVWSGEQLRYGVMAGGAVKSDWNMAIAPLVQEFLDKRLVNNRAEAVKMVEDVLLVPLVNKLVELKMTTDQDVAKSMVKGLFMYVRHQLYIDNGHANSVTPAANFLSLSSNRIIMAMIKAGFVAEMQKEVDLAQIGNSRKLQHALPQKWIDRFSEFYPAIINHAPSCEYFRGQMPFPVKPQLLAMYSQWHLEKTLPTPDQIKAQLPKEAPAPTEAELVHMAFEQSALKDLVSVEKYLDVRQTLLGAPADKNAATALLGTGNPAVQLFVDEHIGVNVMPEGHGVREIGPTVIEKVDELARQKRLNISREGAILAGLSYGITPKGELKPEVIKLCEFPSAKHPRHYPHFIDPWGRSAEEIKDIADMAALKVDTLQELFGRRAVYNAYQESEVFTILMNGGYREPPRPPQNYDRHLAGGRRGPVSDFLLAAAK